MIDPSPTNAALGDTPETFICPRCGGSVRRLIAGECPACLARGIQRDMEDSPPARRVQPDELAPEIDGIEIHEPLGAGGMGVVFRGQRDSDGEPVAVKVLPRALCAEPEWCERFQREASALSALDHPGIVKILATGTTRDGRLYLAMELVEGCDLRNLLRTGKLEPARALEIAEKVAGALSHAHSRGIVHRDVKPGNILVGTDGVVKVADFGIARAVAGEASSWTLTQTREAFGTPYYLAPELAADASAASPASDVYALGVMLYEMLTGHLPMGHFTPASQASGVDARIDTLLSAAMADKPAARLSDMPQFTARLHALQTRISRQASRRRWRIAALAAAALAVTGAAGAWIGWKNAPSAAGPVFPDPAKASRHAPWENSLGLRFIPVPDSPGILMALWETRRSDLETFTAELNIPREQEEVADGNLMKLQTVQDAREVYIDASWDSPGFSQTPVHPAVGIPLTKVRIFCQWLTIRERMEGRILKTRHYRLPSTEEWQRAFGSDGGEGNLPGPEVIADGWPADGEHTDRRDDFIRTAPVGSFLPNAAGFYDLTGNVSEMCANISAPAEGKTKFNYSVGQFLRGSSWRALTPPNARPSARPARPGRSHERRADAGFRLVLEL